MSESHFYHIPKSGKLVPCAKVEDAMALTEQEGSFFWLHYLEPTSEELRPLISLLDLHPLAIEDALDDNQLPKIDDFPSNSFIIFNAFSYADEKVDILEVDFFLGKHFVISIDRIGPDGKPLMDGIQETVMREMAEDRQGPAFVLHTMLDVIVDRKVNAIEAMEDRLAAAEDAVMDRPTDFEPKSLQQIRHILVKLRRSLFHEREVFVKISRKDCPFIPDKAIYQFRDIYDHLARFFELAESLRDIATSLMEIDLSVRSNEMARASNRTNRSVRRLTLITIVFLPLSLLASIGGMSEWTMMTGAENWRITYPLFLLGLVLIGTLSYFLLKWIIRHDDHSDNDGTDI
ncbi:MAG: Mg2+/Co2+ transporter [Candidatus Melainabacteria bacterium HGW-Melainabacteria-1]|jgi:magnesium transporter|nr:MAG: Mg2+/Co2+ transporter [Candidatus Melainabacteria bacterium HGW-Melainabacteria-1]PKM39943.1 MAG: Mg2+/Co2+ transporter [Firmicutes bacterium HGW-Firmicutes-9]